MKKVLYKECLALRNKAREGGASGVHIGHMDCFIVSGSKVLEVVGSYIAIASAASLIFYTVLMIRFFIQLGKGEPAR